MRGAEAILRKDGDFLIKDRIEKKYRIKELDQTLRKGRTRKEANLLRRAKRAGIPVPEVFSVGEYTIKISLIKGKHPKENISNVKKAGEILARLHSEGIIHGDFTFANLLLNKKMYVIDFGLGYFSNSIEHKTIDVFTMMRSLHSKKLKDGFLKSYLSNSKVSKEIRKRLEVIENRVRYS